MNSKKIRFEYDRDADAAYLKIARGKVLESEEVQPGVIVDLDAEGRILGVEILRFGKRFMTQAKGRDVAIPRGRSLKKSA
jgi:uncharacterized protein YuzE